LSTTVTKNKIYNITATVISQRKINSDCFHLIIKPAGNKNIKSYSNILPGQFVSIKCGNGTYLRRPFSIAYADKNRIELIYKVVGYGTKWLSEQEKGNKLDILFPLGNGFPIPEFNKDKPVSVILVAGGTGIVTLSYLARKLSTVRQLVDRERIIIYYGARTEKELIYVNKLRKFCSELKIVTEDGSAGYKGLATDLFADYILDKQNLNLLVYVYACGPRKMLQKIYEITKNSNILCYASLEEVMACGIGACRGCVINTVNGYKTVCKDGPVFKINEILW